MLYDTFMSIHTELFQISFIIFSLCLKLLHFPILLIEELVCLLRNIRHLLLFCLYSVSSIVQKTFIYSSQI